MPLMEQTDPPSAPPSETPEPSSPERVIRDAATDLGFAVLDRFLAAAETLARSHGGRLTPQQLTSLAERMRARAGDLAPVVEPQLHRLRNLWLQVRHDHLRKQTLGRLLVHRFEHLLSDADLPPEGQVPRAMLPAFFGIMEMLLGEETVYRQQARADARLAALRVDHGPEGFDWAAAYDDPKLATIVDEVLVAMAEALEQDFADRRTRVVTALASHRPLVPLAWPEDFDDRLFNTVMNALYASLCARAGDPDRAADIAAHHGRAGLAAVTGLCRDLGGGR